MTERKLHIASIIIAVITLALIVVNFTVQG